MKKLIPSLRERKRYIAFEIDSEHAFDKSNVIKAVDTSCRNFLGEYGYGKAGVMLVDNAVSSNGKRGVVRVNSKYADLVKVSLMMIKEINNNKVALRNVKTSGMLGKVKVNG
ncbi:hypothetical protein HYV89_03810 [Candidatus Woesearchaeota archaeon]|nr:hypothetical protein [Candidatus Woesearchaeota archaeon]